MRGYKRKRSTYNRAKRYMKKPVWNKNKRRKPNLRRVAAQTNRLVSMIETKEGTHTTGDNLGLAHNNTYIVAGPTFGTGNFLRTSYGTEDPMNGMGQRVGDKITLRGVKFVAFFENAIARSKVHYRILCLRGARGAAFDRATIFKGDSGNKMIDQVNTERYTILYSKRFNIGVGNAPAQSALATGEPSSGSGYYAGQGTKVISAWIPGRKFGKGGNLQYESQSFDPKFYDYRFVILAYDWFGTPQDVNNVGRLNSAYIKLYYKDA